MGLFDSKQLNEQGVLKYDVIQKLFEHLEDRLSVICPPSREYALAKTKLEEACFFAKKAMCSAEVNHVVPVKVHDDGDQVSGA